MGDVIEDRVGCERAVGVHGARQFDELLRRLLGRHHRLALSVGALPLRGARDDDVEPALAVAAARHLVQPVQLPHVFGQDWRPEHNAVQKRVGRQRAVAHVLRLDVKRRLPALVHVNLDVPIHFRGGHKYGSFFELFFVHGV